nr:dirigent protein 1-like [Quercus suber]
MATNLVPKRLKNLFLVLVLANITYLAKATEPKKATLSLYFHDAPDRCDSNVKVIPVTRIAGKAWNVPKTGTVIVTEDLITKNSGQNSAEVGRAKGMYVTAGSNGLDSQVSISIEFTDEEYKGSTIEIQGISNQFMPDAEVSVVGGTGKFRFARGYATFATHHLDIPNRFSLSLSLSQTQPRFMLYFFFFWLILEFHFILMGFSQKAFTIRTLFERSFDRNAEQSTYLTLWDN